MRVSFSDLSTEVPDGWCDESTITFTMPADPRLTAMGQSAAGSVANVVINWRARGAQTLDVFVQERLGGLRRALPGFKLQGQGELAAGIPYLEYSFALQLPVLQILIVREVGDVFVCVTGTAVAGQFAGVRPLFAQVALGLQKRRDL